MKLVPGHLPPIPTGTSSLDRLPLPLPFSSDLFWRYPMGLPSISHPSSPLLDYKSQLPASLASDPRVWSREDVITFLRWAEREFDLQAIDMDMFQINGKAMCLLTRNDLSERAPGSGDVLHNVLQILLREANSLQRMLPSSPVTPTSRHAYPLSPHSHPSTPNWSILTQNNESAFHPTNIAAQLMAQSNSVTLSPAPSVDSQSGSPPQHPEIQPSFGHSIFNTNGSNGSGSNPSDSDEDVLDVKNGYVSSPPNTPSYLHGHSTQMQGLPPRSPKLEGVSSPGAFKREFFGSESVSSPGAYKREFFGNEPSPGMYKREFFGNDSSEPSTNGRLLWDFLQQLLNDPAQRYTNFIAWKNSETGVFKIVDPAGLAKLWGIQKNHLSMNYDKMSRALRYYYRVNILRKVQGERHCYQFLRNPTELRNIKNISLLRQRMDTAAKPQIQIIPQISIKREFEPLKPETTQTHEMPHPSLPNSTTITPATEMDHSDLSHKVNNLIKNHYDLPQKPKDSREEWTPQNMSTKNPNIVWKNENITVECDEMPTDLSIDGPTDLSSTSSRHVNIVCSPDPPISTTDH